MRGRILLFLFALPFFGVGVWMAYSIGSTLVDARQMQAWVPVDATLTRAGYETHSGDDSDTYEAYAQYSYAYGGRTYNHDRVAISGGADNIGDYQQDLGRRLSSAMRRGETIVVYVDPDNPAESIIDRGIRWGLLGFKSIFLFVFGGVGLGMIIWACRAPGESDASAPEFIDQPWLANDNWQSATVRSSSKKAMWFAWGFAAFWNLISAALPFIIYREVVDKENYLALIGLLFPLIGVGLLFWAVRQTLEWRRFGPAPVTLDPFPGSIGGHVGGTIDINLPFRADARFSTTLTSLRSYLSGSGDDRSRKESAEWQDTMVAHAAHGPKGTRLSFRFDVPDELRESDALQSEDYYYLWRLNVTAELPGTDFDRDYEIPVYATAQLSSSLSNISIDEARSRQGEIDLQAIRELVRLDYGVSGKSMLYPIGRHLLSGLGGFIIGCLFAAIGWFLISYQGHPIMGGVFGLVGLVILISSAYFVLNSLEVIQDGGRIRSIRRMLGFPVRTRELRRADFARFSKKSSMSSQSGNKHVMYYTLYAHDRTGRQVTLGEGFRGAGQAEAAADLISREFGLAAREVVEERNFGSDDVDFLAAD